MRTSLSRGALLYNWVGICIFEVLGGICFHFSIKNSVRDYLNKIIEVVTCFQISIKNSTY